MRLVRFALSLAVLAAAVPLGGCNALAGLLRTDTGANAPVNQATGGAGVSALPGSTVVIIAGRQDARGDVGASGQTSASGQASQSTSVDPRAIAEGAAALLKTVPADSPAAGLARAAREVSATHPEDAARLLEAAKTAPRTPATVLPGQPSPGAPAPGQTPPAPPEAATKPAEGTLAPAPAPAPTPEPAR